MEGQRRGPSSPFCPAVCHPTPANVTEHPRWSTSGGAAAADWKQQRDDAGSQRDDERVSATFSRVFKRGSSAWKVWKLTFWRWREKRGKNKKRSPGWVWSILSCCKHDEPGLKRLPRSGWLCYSEAGLVLLLKKWVITVKSRKLHALISLWRRNLNLVTSATRQRPLVSCGGKLPAHQPLDTTIVLRIKQWN